LWEKKTMTWLDVFVPEKIRPVRPVGENGTGRREIVVAVTSSSSSSSSSTEKGNETLIAKSADVSPARRRCFGCPHWAAKPGSCWWVALCDVNGHRITWQDACSLPDAKGVRA
jgi:hypothetical protein